MMVKRLLIVLFVFALLPFSLMADWVSVDKNKTSNTPPIVTLLSQDNNSTVIKIDISGFDLNEFISDGKTYQTVDLLTDVFSTKNGSPELPHIAKILAIPDQAAVSVEIIETEEVQIFENIFLKKLNCSILRICFNEALAGKKERPPACSILSRSALAPRD